MRWISVALLKEIQSYFRQRVDKGRPVSAEIGTDRKRFYRNFRQLLHTASEKVLRRRDEDCQQGNGNTGKQEVIKITCCVSLFPKRENLVADY